ncbi:hypothetical protein [Nonomuraea roseoviolacea]|uniref:Uncharacterized protein n=1 Tax=Nonomuraea roseoviolacea subsp. carminata TaxID=160689 RepID=A0ABT1JW77_9ACTN|nr:hypothetical protein [Nonomuraea roseoviolacea]MCP2345657.1 hypothetical protein [Nonomuraea roseoviolacea subsp. carminata]
MPDETSPGVPVDQLAVAATDGEEEPRRAQRLADLAHHGRAEAFAEQRAPVRGGLDPLADLHRQAVHLGQPQLLQLRRPRLVEVGGQRGDDLVPVEGAQGQAVGVAGVVDHVLAEALLGDIHPPPELGDRLTGLAPVHPSCSHRVLSSPRGDAMITRGAR